MKQFRFNRRSRSLSVCGLLTTAVVFMASSPALATKIDESGMAWGDTSTCGAAALTQPFASAGDSNWYTMVPGETPGAFGGAGWTLSGGASIKVGPDRHRFGARPAQRLAGDQPADVRVVGLSDGTDDGARRRRLPGRPDLVAYAGTKTESKAQNVGQVHGQGSDWTLGNSLNIHPGDLPGWQLVRFTFVPDGKSSDFQVYNFYVDPRMHN